MERFKYFNTPEGQIHLRRARLKSWFYINIDQEPRSKKIKSADAIYFQTKILEELKRHRKRAYTSPIILQIDFYTSEKTPPGIHSLAKNYLDLLENPVPGLKIKCKKILYNNDRQIKVLIVNYRLGEGPAIRIQAEPLRSFIDDLDFIRRIETSDFEESKKYEDHELGSARNKLRKELNGNDQGDDGSTVRDLKQFEAQKDLYIKKHDLKSYQSYRDFIVWDIQRNYLKNAPLGINWLLSIFPSPYLDQKSKATGIKKFSEIANIGRNFVSTLGIRLPHKPTEKGKTIEFKMEIKVILEDFKKKYPVLFPLKSVLGITVLFLPPKTENIDLDNLVYIFRPFWTLRRYLSLRLDTGLGRCFG